MPGPHETLRVDEQRWQEAQVFERACWADSNRRNGVLKLAKRCLDLARRPCRLARVIRYRDFGCSHDWSFWWRAPAFRRRLPREPGRNPAAHRGTYLFAGAKR